MSIPKIIHQTWKNKDIPDFLLENVNKWKEMNPDYEYEYYDNDKCRKFILNNMGFKTALTFDILKPGAFKADLFRYCVLYIRGGVYTDIDLVPLVPLDKIIDEEHNFFSVKERDHIHNFVINGVWQGFIACEPGLEVFKIAIDKIVDNAIFKYYPSDICQDWNKILSITGPQMFGNIIKDFCRVKSISHEMSYNGIRVKLFKFRNVNNKIIYDLNNNEIIKLNDTQNWITSRENYVKLFIDKKVYRSNINTIHNFLSGRDCVILTCGPSLTEYDKSQIREFCKGKIVICIKESILEYGDICDIFFANESRFRNYDLDNSYLKIYQKGKKVFKDIRDKYDMILEEDLEFRKDQMQILKTREFEKYDMTKTTKRPWGPGILYESVFYFCKYIGIANVYTIGWDLIDPVVHDNIKHYFEDYDNGIYNKSLKFGKECNECEYEKFYKGIEFKKEMTFVNSNISYMYDYFKDSGMSIYVVGHQSYVNNYIPRIYLD